MIQRSSFSSESLSRFVRAGDSQRFKIDLKIDREAIVTAASTRALEGAVALGNYSRATIKGKQCISYSDYETNLVLRSIAGYLSRRFRIASPNRERIINGVIEGLMDTTPMYVIRRDVTSFYETVPVDDIRNRLLYETSIPKLVRHYLHQFFDQHCGSSSKGLPRGVGLSAVLVELAMEKFDRQVRAIPGVYRYFRYSDDMLVFAYKNPAEVAAQIDRFLPSGMDFNPDKSSISEFDLPRKGAATLTTFEYLGYCFEADRRSGTPTARRIVVGISPKKIRRLKSRIILSLKAYHRDRNASLLLDRLKFLSGNHRIHRRGMTAIRESPYVKSGIYYNYRNCGIYEDGKFTEIPPRELLDLDHFLHGLVHGRKSTFAATLRGNLDGAQKATLKKVSFLKGFASRLVVRMDYSRFTQIKSVWRNVK